MNDSPIIIKKKKVHGHAAHHGGSWKVAYADFVTAMMAFFMVMWILGLSDETRASIQGYFNDPIGFNKTHQRSKSVIDIPSTMPRQKKPTTAQQIEAQKKKEDSVRRIAKQVENLGKGNSTFATLLKNVQLQMTGEGLRIEFVESAGSVFFDSGNATIKPGARQLINEIAPILAKSNRKMIIEGHTDAQPYPSTSYTNWDLSNDRSNSLRRLLMSKGVSEKQILETRAYADRKLKDPEHPLSYMNRRVTLLLPYEDGDTSEETLTESLSKNLDGQFNHAIGVAPSKPQLVQSRG